MEGHQYSQTLCLWCRCLFLYHMIQVSKGGFMFLDWQIAQSRVYFVPLYENKKI